MAGPAALLLAALLGGCVGIPTGGGVTTDEIDTAGTDESLASLPPGPADDASPADIISGFIRAGRGPQKNYEVAREYLTDDFRLTWIPGASTLISATPISPVALADNTWNVSVTHLRQRRRRRALRGRPPTPSTCPFGLVQNDDGQWRISSAPDGTLLPPNRVHRHLQVVRPVLLRPDVRVPGARPALVPERVERAATGSSSQLLLGPSPWQGSGVLFSAFPTGTEQERPARDRRRASRRSS